MHQLICCQKIFFKKFIMGGKKSFTINDIFLSVSKGLGYSDRIEPEKSSEFGVDLLIGNPKLSRQEDFLARDWNDMLAGSERGMRTSLIFKDMLNKLPKYDFVVIDMGPSLGAINRAVLLASDYFITPMSSDIFSILALENIGDRLVEWKKIYRWHFEN